MLFKLLHLPPQLQAYLVYSVFLPIIYARSLGSFYWRMTLENKIWILGMLIGSGVLFLSQFSFDKTIYMGLIKHYFMGEIFPQFSELF